MHLPQTKNGDERDVALSPAAVALLRLFDCQGCRTRRALVPLSNTAHDNAFGKARKRAGLVGLRFHDSRREAATRMSKLLNPFELAAQTGHRDLKVLMSTYYGIDAKATAQKLAQRFLAAKRARA